MTHVIKEGAETFNEIGASADVRHKQLTEMLEEMENEYWKQHQYLSSAEYLNNDQAQYDDIARLGQLALALRKVREAKKFNALCKCWIS